MSLQCAFGREAMNDSQYLQCYEESCQTFGSYEFHARDDSSTAPSDSPLLQGSKTLEIVPKYEESCGTFASCDFSGRDFSKADNDSSSTISEEQSSLFDFGIMEAIVEDHNHHVDATKGVSFGNVTVYDYSTTTSVCLSKLCCRKRTTALPDDHWGTSVLVSSPLAGRQSVQTDLKTILSKLRDTMKRHRRLERKLIKGDTVASQATRTP